MNSWCDGAIAHKLYERQLHKAVLLLLHGLEACTAHSAHACSRIVIGSRLMLVALSSDTSCLNGEALKQQVGALEWRHDAQQVCQHMSMPCRIIIRVHSDSHLQGLWDAAGLPREVRQARAGVGGARVIQAKHRGVPMHMTCNDVTSRSRVSRVLRVDSFGLFAQNHSPDVAVSMILL